MTGAAILHVVGARPNYMKVAPIWRAVTAATPGARQTLLNTGQHRDDDLSGVFLRAFGLPPADWDLGAASEDRAALIALVTAGVEAICRRERPAVVVVVGDVNSTLGAAFGAAAAGVPLAHVEAGLRSFDRAMPEEINRIETDRLSDLLFTPSADAEANLRREGIEADRIHPAGNVMIDTLMAALPEATFDRVSDRFAIGRGEYALCTLHRAANVDEPAPIRSILAAIDGVAKRMPVVFPMHPRTRRRVAEFGLAGRLERIRVTDPLGYLDCLSLTAHARVVLTDSGGLQEESAFLGVPCLTLRDNTERPATLASGTVRLVGCDTAAILSGFADAIDGPRVPVRPDGWDGHAAPRIAAVLRDFLTR